MFAADFAGAHVYEDNAAHYAGPIVSVSPVQEVDQSAGYDDGDAQGEIGG
jgi:hypothetical protein